MNELNGGMYHLSNIGAISQWLAAGLVCIGLGFALQASAQSGRDPFAPYVIEEPEIVIPGNPEEGDKEVVPQKPPLERYPLSDYRLIGVLKGPKESVALIRTPERKDFYLHLSDKLGNQEGVVEAIEITGITVNEGGSRTILRVQNRIVTSNESS